MKNKIIKDKTKNLFFKQRNDGKFFSNATEFVVRVTRNNLFLLVRSLEGELLAWTSNGRPEFTYSRVLNSHTMDRMAQPLLSFLRMHKLWVLKIIVRTNYRIGALLRSMRRWKIYCWKIDYDIRIPFNGCRGRKTRRL